MYSNIIAIPNWVGNIAQRRCAFWAQLQKCLWIASKLINICKCCWSWTWLPSPSPPNTRDVLISPTSGSLKPQVHAVCCLFIYLKLSANEDSNSSVTFTQLSRPQLVLSLFFWGGAQKQCSTFRGTAVVVLVGGAVNSSPQWSTSDPMTKNTTCFKGRKVVLRLNSKAILQSWKIFFFVIFNRKCLALELITRWENIISQEKIYYFQT